MTEIDKSEIESFLITAYQWVSGFRSEISRTQHIPVLLVDNRKESKDETDRLMDKMLGAINLSRKENCLLVHLGGTTQDQLRKELTDTINLYNPLIILEFGRNISKQILGKEDPTKDGHGTILNYNGCPFISTYHPEDLLIDSSLKRQSWEDLKLLKSEYDRLLSQ